MPGTNFRIHSTRPQDYDLAHGVLSHSIELVQTSLRLGADPNLRVQPSNTLQYLPLLHHAVFSRIDTIVALLLEHGAALTCSEGAVPDSPLHSAVSTGQYSIAKLLLQHSPPELLRQPAYFDVIDIASGTFDGSGMVELLLSHGAYTHSHDRHEMAPIVFAVANACPLNLKTLLRAGSDPDTRLETDVFSPLSVDEYGPSVSLMEIASLVGGSECETILRHALAEKKAYLEARVLESQLVEADVLPLTHRI